MQRHVLPANNPWQFLFKRSYFLQVSACTLQLSNFPSLVPACYNKFTSSGNSERHKIHIKIASMLQTGGLHLAKPPCTWQRPSNRLHLPIAASHTNETWQIVCTIRNPVPVDSFVFGHTPAQNRLIWRQLNALVRTQLGRYPELWALPGLITL